MSDWRTDGPPIGEEIEFETDRMERLRGKLKYGGTNQRYVRGKRTGEDNDLFISDVAEGLFIVLRWRKLPED